MSAKNPLCDKCVLLNIQCSGHLTQCEEKQMWMARKEMKEREGCDCVHTCKHAIIDFSHDNKTDYCVLSTDCPHKKKTMEKLLSTKFQDTNCDCTHMTGRDNNFAQVCCYPKGIGYCVFTVYGAVFKCPYYNVKIKESGVL